VATAVRPDILIVDEALSVGDTYFQHKSFDRIRRFLAQGTTLLFVSHSPAAIKSICQRALLLDQGSIVMDGEPEQVLDYYNAIIARSHADYEIKSLTSEDGARGLRSGTGEATIERVELIVDGASVHALYSGQAAQLKVYARSRDALEQLTVGILIRDRFGNDVFGTNTMLLGETLPRRAGEGSYSITVALHSQEHHIADNYDWWDRALVFEVVADSASGVGVCHFPIQLRWHNDEDSDQDNNEDNNEGAAA
jgi:lipopolysaccharide transport system ATP-binding protein